MRKTYSEIFKPGKPLASISLDLDNQWSYMKTHGDAGWQQFPSYLSLVVPQVLDIFDQLKLKITFFIVGQDAELDQNRDALALLTKKGHEVGNHSFHHEPWLHLYTRDRIKREILQAENSIFSATGQKPFGFRGPGFSWSPALLQVLAELGYLYDASVLPTYLGPLGRMYYFWKSNLSKEEKIRRGKLFGSFKEGLGPVKPYFWEIGSGEKILEIPITTMPLLKTPFHLSYLLYLAKFSNFLMLMYLRLSLALCRLTGTAPSFLLHPLDLLSKEQVPELAFFPGMDLEMKRKLELFVKVIQKLAGSYDLVNMSTYAHVINQSDDLSVRKAV